MFVLIHSRLLQCGQRCIFLTKSRILMIQKLRCRTLIDLDVEKSWHRQFPSDFRRRNRLRWSALPSCCPLHMGLKLTTCLPAMVTWSRWSVGICWESFSYFLDLHTCSTSSSVDIAWGCCVSSTFEMSWDWKLLLLLKIPVLEQFAWFHTTGLSVCLKDATGILVAAAWTSFKVWSVLKRICFGFCLKSSIFSGWNCCFKISDSATGSVFWKLHVGKRMCWWRSVIWNRFWFRRQKAVPFWNSADLQECYLESVINPLFRNQQPSCFSCWRTSSSRMDSPFWVWI